MNVQGMQKSWSHCVCMMQVPNNTLFQVRRAFKTALGSSDSVCIPPTTPHVITASCPEDQYKMMIDRVGLHTHAHFVNRGSQTKVVYRCRLCDKPDRKHGNAPSPKTSIFTPRANCRTSVLCSCKAVIYVRLHKGEAHLRMHLTHTGHKPNTPSDLRTLPTRREVIQKIWELSMLTSKYAKIRQQLRSWANEVLKPELGLPKGVARKKKSSTKAVFVDRRFNPTCDDIKNVLQGRAGLERYSDIDQEDTFMQLCSDRDLSWACRPHAGGNVTLMYTPDAGLHALATHADLNMHSKCLESEWDEKSFQVGVCGFLEASIQSANRKVGDTSICVVLVCCIIQYVAYAITKQQMVVN